MTNERERSEPSEGPVVRDITGFVRLQPGSNFYDQFPFDELIGLVATEYSGEEQPSDELLSNLRLLLTNRAARNSQATTRSQELILSSRTGRSGGIPYGDMINRLVSELDGYFTDWDRYVDTQWDNAYYQPDGTLKVRSRPTAAAGLPRTYMGWIEEEIRRDRRIQRGMLIQSGFPQLGGSTTAPDRSLMRTWRITSVRGLRK